MRKIVIIAVICLFGMNLTACHANTDLSAGSQTQEEKDLATLSQRLVSMKKNMDKFVKDMTAVYGQGSAFQGAFYGSEVKVDIIDKGEDILVIADLPGMDKDKIDIILEGGKLLRISGTRSMVTKEVTPGVVKQERMEGRFERVLELPVECKSEGIKASYESGVLEITIPKKEPKKIETVKVKVE